MTDITPLSADALATLVEDFEASDHNRMVIAIRLFWIKVRACIFTTSMEKNIWILQQVLL